jgi:hypothetical protein
VIDMGLELLTPFVLVLLGLVVFLKLLEHSGWLRSKPRERLRRGTGHMLLGFQEFIEPSVEHIFETENLEHKEEEDLDADEDNPEAIANNLALSLSRTPIDPDEVRRHLAGAVRAGLDWHQVYADAVADELTARPFRAPSIPPVWRVAPRDTGGGRGTGQ